MGISTRTRRIIAVVLAAGFTITTVGAGSGASMQTPTAVSASTERVGPQFYSGLIVDVSGEVDGDVYASGQSVTISADVKGDVIAAAQTITITGTVDGDVRLVGQDVTVSGTVARSATVFAGSLTIADGGVFHDDLVGSAGAVTIDGQVGRDVLVSVGRLNIAGSVGRNVTYYSENEAGVVDGAVGGSVKRIEPPQAPKVEVSPWAVVGGWLLGLLYALVALSLITVTAGLLLPRWLRRVTDHLVPRPWKALLVGFLASISVPVLLIALLVTIVGAPLALAVLLVWLVLTLGAFVCSAFYLGRLLLRDRQPPVAEALVGGLVLIVALQIPWLNVLVWLAMTFLGVGAQLLEFHDRRPWRPEIESAAQTSGTLPVVAADRTDR